MTRRRLLLSLLGLAALAILVIVWQLPPRAQPAEPPTFASTWPVVRGAYHVHSERSDGTGTLDEIAAAASRAGLQFVIVTDHGDGTRPPAPPAYRSGVLCLDGVELSTEDGHYVALGLAQTPYPLRGRGRDVIEDVQRWGGFGFVAHPDSPKPGLQWRDWEAPVDGVEWLNADSEWRDEFWASLSGMLLTYPFRPVETLTALLDRPHRVLATWDGLQRERRVAVLAGADAHARLGYRQTTDPYEDVVIARVPSYEVSFRAFSNHVILREAWSGDPVHDAEILLAGLREGHAFTSIDGLAALGAFEAKAISGNAAATPGGYLDITGPVAIEAAIAAPAGTTLALVRDGELLYETRERALRVDVGTEPGAYRIEARLPQASGRHIPWVLTNPMYVGMRAAHAQLEDMQALPPATSRTPIATDRARAEASDGSRSALSEARLNDGTPAIAWEHALGGDPQGSPFAAMQFPVDQDLSAQDRLQLRVRSDQPRRVWAQLRTPDNQRWGRSFYVDSELTVVELPLRDFRPVGATSSAAPPLERIDSLLLVIDTVHTTAGSTGRTIITDLWFAR